MRLRTVSVFVDDQQRALEFYRDVLGFALAADVPLADRRRPEGAGRHAALARAEAGNLLQLAQVLRS